MALASFCGGLITGRASDPWNGGQVLWRRLGHWGIPTLHQEFPVIDDPGAWWGRGKLEKPHVTSSKVLLLTLPLR